MLQILQMLQIFIYICPTKTAPGVVPPAVRPERGDSFLGTYIWKVGNEQMLFSDFLFCKITGKIKNFVGNIFSLC